MVLREGCRQPLVDVALLLRADQRFVKLDARLIVGKGLLALGGVFGGAGGYLAKHHVEILASCAISGLPSIGQRDDGGEAPLTRVKIAARNAAKGREAEGAEEDAEAANDTEGAGEFSETGRLRSQDMLLALSRVFSVVIGSRLANMSKPAFGG